MERVDVPGYVEDLLGRPVRWATDVAGDYRGRERTLEVFNVGVGDQLRMLRILGVYRAEIDQAAGGAIVVLWHTPGESLRLHREFLGGWLSAHARLTYTQFREAFHGIDGEFYHLWSEAPSITYTEFDTMARELEVTAKSVGDDPPPDDVADKLAQSRWELRARVEREWCTGRVTACLRLRWNDDESAHLCWHEERDPPPPAPSYELAAGDMNIDELRQYVEIREHFEDWRAGKVLALKPSGPWG